MTDRADRLILGTRKGLLVLERQGGAFEVATVAHRGIPVPYAFLDHRTGTLWASLDHGHWGQKLSRSSDGGSTWHEVPAPAYPEGAEVKRGTPATLRYLWVLAPGGDDHPGVLYAGTEPGGLFRSDDGGDSFRLVEGLWNHPSRPELWMGGGRDHAGLHSVVVDPRDSTRVLVGVSVAGVFETTDDGATWHPRNRGLQATYHPDPEPEVGHDPHLVTCCRAQPDVLWQQNHCGVFRSADGGGSWTEVSQEEGPVRFGFAIAADPRHPERAWVVPATADDHRYAVDGALTVCRTDDGGASWTEQRRGLPQKDCWDVVFRHALDLRDSTLAFGSTTGNLFLSDDEGESWQLVGSHLPPIYSVRFV